MGGVQSPVGYRVPALYRLPHFTRSPATYSRVFSLLHLHVLSAAFPHSCILPYSVLRPPWVATAGGGALWERDERGLEGYAPARASARPYSPPHTHHHHARCIASSILLMGATDLVIETEDRLKQACHTHLPSLPSVPHPRLLSCTLIHLKMMSNKRRVVHFFHSREIENAMRESRSQAILRNS